MSLVKNKIISLLVLILIYGSLNGQTLNWKSLNGPMGGFVGDIAINSKGDLFVGLYSYHIPYYGLFKSTNNGISWEVLSLPFYWSQIYSLYVTKDDHIWIGTYYGHRVYLSTDNGETWLIRNNGFFGPACWAFGQTKNNVLLGGDAEFGRLYRTTNYGENWMYVTSLGPLAFATDSNNVVYMGTHLGLFASSDEGLTWTQIINNISVSTILIDNENNIYCGTGYYDQGSGVLFSSNGGVNWAQIGLSGMKVLSLAMDSEGSIYAGTEMDGLFKTTNRGQSWIQIMDGLNGADVFRLKIGKRGDIFVGAEKEGVYRLRKGESKFEQIGIPVSYTKNFVFFQDSLIFASTPSGVQKYNKYLKKWTNIGLRGVNKVVISSNNNLYAGTDFGLYKSTDLGSSWSELRIANDTVFKIYNFEVISDDTIFIKTNYNLRYTYDGGVTWITTNIQADHLSPVLFYSKTGGLFFTGYALPGYTYNLYRSRDGCITLDTLLIGTPMNYYYYNNFLVTDNGYVYFGGSWDSLLYRSTNFGNSWVVDAFYGFGSIYVINDSIVLIGSSKNRTLGISKDYGKNWYFLNPDIDYRTGIIDIKYKDGKFYFATTNLGMLYSDFDSILDVEREENNLVVKNYTVYQNYPNPFNSKTKIRFRIPSVDLNSAKGDQITTLKVYDLLGREIATLINEPKQAGEYEVEFNADKYNLSSGVYLYELRSGSFQSAKKFVLIK